MAKIDLIYQAMDDFGLITSAEARGLGMSNVEMVQQIERGRLVRVARGVYRMPRWPYQQHENLAIAVKSVGSDAFLYGESVVSLLDLAPENRNTIWVGTPKRCRRNLLDGIVVVHISRTKLVRDLNPAKNLKPVFLGGIACQPLTAALIASAQTLGEKRTLKAMDEAVLRGYLEPWDVIAIRKAVQTYEDPFFS